MITPTKYTNINVSLLAISCEQLKVLKKEGVITYTSLFNIIINKKGVIAKKSFLPSLSFLFLLGKIKYYQKNDIIEYTRDEN